MTCGACQHVALQERAASAAPLAKQLVSVYLLIIRLSMPPYYPTVFVLRHVGVGQGRTPLQERPCVCPAAHRGRFNPAQDVSNVSQVWIRLLGSSV